MKNGLTSILFQKRDRTCEYCIEFYNFLMNFSFLTEKMVSFIYHMNEFRFMSVFVCNIRLEIQRQMR